MSTTKPLEIIETTEGYMVGFGKFFNEDFDSYELTEVVKEFRLDEYLNETALYEAVLEFVTKKS